MSPSICVCFYFMLGGFSHSEKQKCHIKNTFKKYTTPKQHFHRLIFTISVLVLFVPNDSVLNIKLMTFME